MKRFVSILSVALILFSLAAVACAVDYETARSYAESEAVPYLKNYVKDPSNGYMGKYFTSESEVDELVLSNGIPIWLFDEELIDSAKKLSEAVSLSGDWLFTLNDPQGRRVLYLSVCELDLGLGQRFGGAVAGFDEAESILKKLGAEEYILIEMGTYRLLVTEKDGDERVIRVDSGGIDEKVSTASSWTDLPTGAAVLDPIQARRGSRQPAEEKRNYGGDQLTETEEAPSPIVQEDTPWTQTPLPLYIALTEKQEQVS